MKGAFFETFKEPLFVVEQTRVGQKEPSVYFYKPFFDEKNQRLDLFGIGVDNRGNVNFKTFYKADSEKRLESLLDDRNLKIKYIKN